MTRKKRPPRKTITPEQAAWYDMIYRCENPKHARYPEYGARGIKVHPDWRGKEGRQRFTDHMGPRPKGSILSRRDTTGDYVPGNVLWLPREEAVRLSRSAIHVDQGGSTVPLAVLAERAGLTPRMVRNRIRIHGWTLEEALTRELPKYRKLTLEQAETAFRRAEAGEPYRIIAADLGCSLNLVSEIYRGKKWPQVAARLRKNTGGAQ